MSMCSNGNGSLLARSPSATNTCSVLRRHTPLGHRGGPQLQAAAIAESVNGTVTGLLQQWDLERRRIVQMERKLDSVFEDKARESDGREKLAEVHGSVTGLLEEVQAQARRIDGLEERLWTRTSGAEMVKQRGKEMEQQVQVLEQQGRLAAAATEEALRRQAVKLCRAEKTIEDVTRRCSAVEEELHTNQSTAYHQDDALVSRLEALEHYHSQLSTDLQTLQVTVYNPVAWPGVTSSAEESSQAAVNMDSALKVMERTNAAFEKKLSTQMEELSFTMAALKVKVEGQLNRLNTLAERMEFVHEPAVESMREELMQARATDRREIDTEITTLRSKLQEVTNAMEDTTSGVRGLQRSQTELSSWLHSNRPDDGQLKRMAEERMRSQEMRLMDLVAQVDELQGTLHVASNGRMTVSTPPQEFNRLSSDVSVLKTRLDALETRGDASTKELAGKTSSASWDVLQQLSRLSQRTSSAEATHNSVQQQLQRLQEKVEAIGNQDTESGRTAMQMTTKVDVLARQVADVQSRILEVEGSVEFAREKDNTSLFPVSEAPSAVLLASEQTTPAREPARAELPPPLPGSRCGDAGESSLRNLEDMLEAMASHLEIVDELAERVAVLERNQPGAKKALQSEGNMGNDCDVEL